MILSSAARYTVVSAAHLTLNARSVKMLVWWTACKCRIPETATAIALRQSDMHAARNPISSRHRLSRRRALLAAIAVLSVGVALLARFGVLMVSNDHYLEAVPALTAMAGSMTVLCLSAPLTMFLRAGGRIDITVVAEVIWLCGSLLVGTLLLPSLGLMGFGLGGVVAAILALLYTLVSMQRRSLPRPPSSLIIVLLPTGLALWAGAAWLGAQPLLNAWPVAFGTAICLTAGLGITFLRSRFLSPEERDRLASFLGAGSMARFGRRILGARPSTT